MIQARNAEDPAQTEALKAISAQRFTDMTPMADGTGGPLEPSEFWMRVVAEHQLLEAVHDALKRRLVDAEKNRAAREAALASVIFQDSVALDAAARDRAGLEEERRTLTDMVQTQKQDIETLVRDCAKWRAAAEDAAAQLDHVHHSGSWRITRPLRVMRRLLTGRHG